MKETIKTFLYTSFLTLVLIVGFFGITSFTNVSNNEKLTELPITDIKAEMAVLKLKEFEYFRNSYVTSDTISNKDMIHYIFDNLKDGDYEIRRIQPLKIVCQVTDKVSFVSDDICRVLVIDNNKLDEYRNLLFKYEKEFEYVDFHYNGYNCVNDNNSYYCLIEDYTNIVDYKGYSLVDSIYSDDNNKVILYEYYFIYRDSECNMYYSDVYCGEGIETPKMDEDTIRKYGVYYRHEFIIENGKINLEKSFIVNE
jgi:hypothetical protein